jgi:hypothetical protein
VSVDWTCQLLLEPGTLTVNALARSLADAESLGVYMRRFEQGIPGIAADGLTSITFERFDEAVEWLVTDTGLVSLFIADTDVEIVVSVGRPARDRAFEALNLSVLARHLRTEGTPTWQALRALISCILSHLPVIYGYGLDEDALDVFLPLGLGFDRIATGSPPLVLGWMTITPKIGPLAPTLRRAANIIGGRLLGEGDYLILTLTDHPGDAAITDVVAANHRWRSMLEEP